MSGTQFDMEHSTVVAADPRVAWDLIRDVRRWPDIFPPCRAAREVERDGDDVLIEITAEVGGATRTWRSRRRERPDQLRVDFYQTDPYPPMASMTGYWQVLPREEGSCRVVLFHGFEITEESAAAGDPPRSVEDAEAWLRSACDRNSVAELAAFKEACERAPGDGGAAEAGGEWLSDTELVFHDSVTVPASAEFAYELLWQVKDWPQLLPHVDEIRLSEDRPDFQRFEMVTTGPAGTHTTESIRRTGPDQIIEYEQVAPPPLLRVHRGRWLFEPDGDGVKVISEHTIEIEPANIEKALGRAYTVREAGLLARHFIGNHSASTLGIIRQRAAELTPAGREA